MDIHSVSFSKPHCRVGSYAVLTENDESISLNFTAPKSGIYMMTVAYRHYDWDQWVRLDITNGEEMTELLPSLPHGKDEISFPVPMFSGKNTVTFTHDFGHELFIYDVTVCADMPLPKKEISPKNDTLYLDNIRKMHATVCNYGDEITALKIDGNPVPFETAPTRCAETNYRYAGNDFFRTELYYNPAELSLAVGKHSVSVCLKSGELLSAELCVKENYEKSPLKIISFDVNHANASMISLPNGKNLLVDSGYDTQCERTILPYLERAGIKVDYYLLTHFHSDHYGKMEHILQQNGLKKPDGNIAAELINADKQTRYDYLRVFSYLDSSMLCTYDELHKIWDLGGVELTAMCSRFDENGAPYGITFDSDIAFNEHNYENATSVSLLLHFGDFGYYHGADNYAYMQQKNLEDFEKVGKKDKLKCNYFYANHHFHIDVNTEFIRTLSPENVYVPANCAVYSRAAYATDYMNAVVLADYPEKRLKNTLITEEIGTAVVEATSDGYYTLTTYKSPEDIV